jgi:hypothetical protein
MRIRQWLLLLVIGGLLAACAGGGEVSVADALDAEGETVQVRGYLFVAQDGTVTLADAILESFPPQPGGASIMVEGLDLSSFDLSSEAGLRWTDDPVVVVGVVQDGELAVSAQG